MSDLPTEVPVQPRTSRNKQIAIVGGIAAVAAIIGFGQLNGDDESESLDDSRALAHAACAEFTRDRLKAPSSADFPEYDHDGVRITFNDDEWTVRSFVDAENSFSAELRTYFVCTVEDRGDTWRLVDWSEG